MIARLPATPRELPSTNRAGRAELMQYGFETFAVIDDTPQRRVHYRFPAAHGGAVRPVP